MNLCERRIKGLPTWMSSRNDWQFSSRKNVVASLVWEMGRSSALLFNVTLLIS